MNNHKAIAFFSGFPDRRFTDEIAERLEIELPVRRCIVFITACPVDYQQTDEDSAGMHRMFEEYSIGFERFCVVDARMEPADAQKWAREADCFFLMGGGVCAEQMQLMQEMAKERMDMLKKSQDSKTALTSDSTYDQNLNTLGYAELTKPSFINIYPKDFESKEKIVDIIKKYNDDAKADGREGEVIEYTDYVGLMMSSITDIISAISYILIAFVAISLVVSSIMIGIITYISVLERTKEIGILRAIGASKKDVSHVFNAETVIVGLTAGLLGIGISYLLTIPINMIIASVTDVSMRASIPILGAVILVAISVVLTLIAGLMPSRIAAKKDPVIALRTE